jgi:hypothetical protein
MNRPRLLAIGTVCLAVGLGLGAFFVTSGGSSAATTTSAATSKLTPTTVAGEVLPPVTDVPTGPGPTDTSGNPVTTIPGQTPGTATTIPGQTVTTIPGSTRTTVTREGSAPTAPVQSTDPKKQLAAVAVQAGFPLFILDDPLWKLQAVRTATVGEKTIVDLSYGAGGDYLSISQEPMLPQTAVPNTERVTVHGAPGELLDMGSVIVIRWNEAATSLALSTSLKRDAALAAAEKLTVYKG